ncbi:hypothetical protein [Pseudomonas kurunegalensis]|uniref:hypothetical protein n=1 Tax=Pseudomonas kurunegalensis TaxID=485880 RepID=UPI00289618C5|nr:hypothetical protein [Pseudomonas kurunegalensis]MDT3749757.1 hypothetical protein [Pseudomonas kurunegalensis]
MLIIGSVRSPGQPFGPDDVKAYTDEVRQAMKLLEPLLQSGYLALHPDRWMQGKLSFMPPRIAKRYGWVPPVVPEPEPAAATCSCACCPKVRG